MSFSMKQYWITQLASHINWGSRDGPPLVNDQMFNILRLVCTKLSLRIDVTWIDVKIQIFFLVEILKKCKPGGQWCWHFSSHNNPTWSHLQTIHRQMFTSSNTSSSNVRFLFQYFQLSFPINSESTELRSLLPEDRAENNIKAGFEDCQVKIISRLRATFT